MPERLRQVHPACWLTTTSSIQDVDDDIWLREAGRRGWVVLMKDDRIRYRPEEQRAVLEARVACFCLHPSKGLTGEDMAEAFVRALPKILRIVTANPGRGYIRRVNRRGQVRRLFP